MQNRQMLQQMVPIQPTAIPGAAALTQGGLVGYEVSTTCDLAEPVLRLQLELYLTGSYGLPRDCFVASLGGCYLAAFLFAKFWRHVPY